MIDKKIPFIVVGVGIVVIHVVWLLFGTGVI